MTRICFVCQGNICRSPLAEGVFKHLAAQAGRAADFEVESAGLGRWHLGDPPDSRAQRVARAHSVALAGRAQQFRAADFARFDLVLALGEDIYTELLELAPSPAARAKVRYLREYDSAAGRDRDVPDPYYGDLRDFEHAYILIERACRGLWADLAAGR